MRVGMKEQGIIRYKIEMIELVVTQTLTDEYEKSAQPPWLGSFPLIV